MGDQLKHCWLAEVVPFEGFDLILGRCGTNLECVPRCRTRMNGWIGSLTCARDTNFRKCRFDGSFCWLYSRDTLRFRTGVAFDFIGRVQEVRPVSRGFVGNQNDR